MKTRIDPRLVTLTAPHTFAAERYQGLRLKLEQLRGQRALKTIAITSPGAGDGKTLTSINLAGVLARETGATVLLIDADLRRSSVSAQLGIDARQAGLADLVAGSTRPLAQLVRRPDDCGFDVLPAGSSSRSLHTLFRSERFTRVLDEAKAQYENELRGIEARARQRMQESIAEGQKVAAEIKAQAQVELLQRPSRARLRRDAGRGIGSQLAQLAPHPGFDGGVADRLDPGRGARRSAGRGGRTSLGVGRGQKRRPIAGERAVLGQIEKLEGDRLCRADGRRVDVSSCSLSRPNTNVQCGKVCLHPGT